MVFHHAELDDYQSRSHHTAICVRRFQRLRTVTAAHGEADAATVAEEDGGADATPEEEEDAPLEKIAGPQAAYAVEACGVEDKSKRMASSSSKSVFRRASTISAFPGKNKHLVLTKSSMYTCFVGQCLKKTLKFQLWIWRSFFSDLDG